MAFSLTNLESNALLFAWSARSRSTDLTLVTDAHTCGFQTVGKSKTKSNS